MSARITLAAIAIALMCATPAFAQSDPLPPPAPEDKSDPKLPKPPPAKTAPKTTPTASTNTGGGSSAAKADSPTVTVKGGEIGLAWRFGGLATMAATGFGRPVPVGTLQLAQIGFKYATSEAFRVVAYFGTALDVNSPDGADSTTQFGMDLGGGIEYHFRIWRKISPFVGGQLNFSVQKPDPGDATIGIGLSGQLGIEYFFADRLSLSAVYQLLLQLGFGGGTRIGLLTASGGALVGTVYF